MPANVLDNLARWNLQIALLALVAAVLVRLLKINAPVVRHAVWRTMLAACLVLPLVQPWRSMILAPVVLAIEEIEHSSLTTPPASRRPLASCQFWLAWPDTFVRTGSPWSPSSSRAALFCACSGW